MDTIRLKKDPPMPEPDPALTPQPEPVSVESPPVGVLQHIRPGDQLGPYTLISRLGRGNFGVVWLAERRGAIATTAIALKMPLDEGVPLDSLRREASLWVKVSGHPNILPIIEAEVYAGQIVIASEYVSGGSLATWLQKYNGAAPTMDTALEVMDGILRGLEHLHDQRVIHRDLKPANIMLQHGSPRLMDFGISRVIENSLLTNTIAGTVQYMAPEAFDGFRTELTDLWAAGVIFYQLVSGKLPFLQMGDIVRRDPFALPATVPEPIQHIILRSLQKEPNFRYQSAGELRDVIRHLWKTASFPSSAVMSSEALPPHDQTAILQTDDRQNTSTHSETITFSEPRPALNSVVFDRAVLDAWGNVVEWVTGECQYFDETLAEGLLLRMVSIPEGSFLMGSPSGEGKSYEKPQHEVKVAPFFLGMFPITQSQWQAVAQLPKINLELSLTPSFFQGDPLLPVEQVSWEEAQEFCDRLSIANRRPFRLPTEAEWEYACRAGTSTVYAFGDNISTDFVNYDGNYPHGLGNKGSHRQKTVPVGSLGVPNGFGIYDMHGNVYEWCQDIWHNSYRNSPTTAECWNQFGDDRYRVLRGGSWLNVADFCRSADRVRFAPNLKNKILGFRIALSF